MEPALSLCCVSALQYFAKEYKKNENGKFSHFHLLTIFLVASEVAVFNALISFL